MNQSGDNNLLLSLLVLIPVYSFIIISLQNHLVRSTYPVAIWMISLSLLLMHSLTSDYITGSDIHLEYYSFQLALKNLHWDVSEYFNSTNACLSITILPVIYKLITGMNSLYVYKLLSQIIFSICPICLFFFFRKYFNRYAIFYLLLFFHFSIYLYFEFPEHIRQEIAFLFVLYLYLYFLIVNLVLEGGNY